MVANISAYRPKNKTVMRVLTITVALDMALSQEVTALAVQAMALRLAELATALRGQVTVLRGPLRVLKLATVLRGQDSILPLQTTTSRKTTCRSSSICYTNSDLSTKTPDFVDKLSDKKNSEVGAFTDLAG